MNKNISIQRIKNLEKHHLLKAIQKIDKEGIPTGADSSYYDVLYQNKRYPPKLIIAYAYEINHQQMIERTSFRGGKNTPCFQVLEKHDFEIVPKEKKQKRAFGFLPFLYVLEGHRISDTIAKKEDKKKEYIGWNHRLDLKENDKIIILRRQEQRLYIYNIEILDIKGTYNSKEKQTHFNHDYNSYQLSGDWNTIFLLKQSQDWRLPSSGWQWSSQVLKNTGMSPLWNERKENLAAKISGIQDLKEIVNYGHEAEQLSDYINCSVDLQRGILLVGPQSQWSGDLSQSTSFYFEKVQTVFKTFQSLDTDLDFANLQKEFKAYEGTYIQFVQQLPQASQKYDLFLLIGKLITYFDRRGSNKEEWNDYSPPRSYADASVRQHHWVNNLLKYKRDGNTLDNINSDSIKNAILYTENPRTEITMLSSKHRKLVSKNLLKKTYEAEQFVQDVKTFFAAYDLVVQNEANRTHLYSCILYQRRKLWDMPEEKTIKIQGLVTADTTDWKDYYVEQFETGECYHAVIWWSKRPTGTDETLAALRKTIDSKSYFDFYISEGKWVKYRATIRDFAQAHDYTCKNWNGVGDVLSFEENFEDYHDDTKKASIVYLLDEMEKLEEPIPIQAFRFYKHYKRPTQDNCQPFVEILAEVPPLTTQLAASDIVAQIHQYILSKGFYYEQADIANFYLSLKTKPFVLLAGISGTGKTQLIKKFAEALGYESNCFIIPVRPDWTDNADLIGYMDLQQQFHKKELLEVILQAHTNPDELYFVVLDEMNLARVEHYLSDFLSIIETRRLEDGKIVTYPLLKKSDLGEHTVHHSALYEVSIPDNLYIIGTVNMDETTHPFSRKVLDRANAIEMNRVHLAWADLVEMPETLEGQVFNDFLKSKYINSSHLSLDERQQLLPVIEKLIAINQILEQADLHFAYRVRDEVAFYLLYNEQSNHALIPIETAFDFQIMQKILPRIQGSSIRVKRVIINLLKYLNNSVNIHEHQMGNEVENTVKKLLPYRYPQSTNKLLFMLKRFEDDGFTSFWL